jgi:zinc/manganese transport system substrate-binding protein
MFRSTTILLTIVLAISTARPAEANLNVVATVPDLAAIAKEIGGKRVSVTSLSLPTQDPHFVDARPSLALRLNQADALIAVGAELEVGWLPLLQLGARNTRIQTGGQGFLDCAAHVEMKQVPAGPIDRTMGDVHPSGNPHYLRAPGNAILCARAIEGLLSRLDPKGSRLYQANLKSFVTDLEAHATHLRARITRFGGASVVSYHDSWVYLMDWLGLHEIGHIEVKPGIPPSPAHVARLLQHMQSANVRFVMLEVHYPSQTAKILAERVGIPLEILPGGVDFAGGQRFRDYLDLVVERMEAPLRQTERGS